MLALVAHLAVNFQFIALLYSFSIFYLYLSLAL